MYLKLFELRHQLIVLNRINSLFVPNFGS